MEKKPDGTPAKTLPDQGGQKHQMVVMNPYDILGTGQGDYFLQEFLVDSLVGRPLSLVIITVGREIMKQGPEGSVGKPIIVFAYLGGFDKNGITPVPLNQDVFDVFSFFFIGRPVTRPADKKHVSFFFKGAKAGRQSSRAFLDPDFLFSLGNAHRKPVGHDEDFVWMGVCFHFRNVI